MSDSSEAGEPNDSGDLGIRSGASAEPEQQAVAVAPTNRLAKETSPYLLQHARNPVDWYPWGEEALERARQQNRPIFLSIGYSACHWCHVMERESFEDPETAKILNAHFVCIKVDREERPDVDEIYMMAVQLMTGRGGWPLSVFLTPDLKPFFGGTYFPPEDRFGMPSFKKVLNSMAEVWRTQQDDISHNTDALLRVIQANTVVDPSSSGAPEATVLLQAVARLKPQFDPQWGGFAGAPKFPPSGAVALLLRHHLHTGDQGSLQIATVTLDRMACGGMYDQIGGGFHRYSTDAYWLVPHFEKMLYDNALLSKVYLEAWQLTGKELYRRVAAGVLDYVLRDMTDAGGGFHSAEDADSEGEEGKFYVWRQDEIAAVLGQQDGTFFCDYYGVSEAGNFEGSNILHVPPEPSESIAELGLSANELEDKLAPLREKLLASRSRRVRPGKDDKLLAAWNGMMISAFVQGYRVLGDRRYLQAARRAADFVLAEMVRDGVLMRTYRGPGHGRPEGTSKLPAYLDDYAEMASALVDLYEATFELRWLEDAEKLTRKMIAEFWDPDHGGFFYTAAVHKNLLVRTKSFQDGAVPSGNSTATLVLLRMAKLLDEAEYAGKAETVLALSGAAMGTQPRAYPNLLCAADFRLHPVAEFALAGKPKDNHTKYLLGIIHGRFIPNKVMALVEPGSPGQEAVQDRVPLLSAKTMISGKTTVYVCENFACKQPVSDAAALETILSEAGYHSRPQEGK